MEYEMSFIRFVFGFTVQWRLYGNAKGVKIACKLKGMLAVAERVQMLCKIFTPSTLGFISAGEATLWIQNAEYEVGRNSRASLLHLEDLFWSLDGSEGEHIGTMLGWRRMGGMGWEKQGVAEYVAPADPTPHVSLFLSSPFSSPPPSPASNSSHLTNISLLCSSTLLYTSFRLYFSPLSCLAPSALFIFSLHHLSSPRLCIGSLFAPK